MNNNIRTLLHFVEDLFSNGKSLTYILVVAQSTRWQGKKEDISNIILDLSKKMKKKYKIPNTSIDNISVDEI